MSMIPIEVKICESIDLKTIKAPANLPLFLSNERDLFSVIGESELKIINGKLTCKIIAIEEGIHERLRIFIDNLQAGIEGNGELKCGKTINFTPKSCVISMKNNML